MAKFFKIDEQLINLSQISDVIFKEDKLTISFTVSGKGKFNKICSDEKEFKDVCNLVSNHLEIIDLGETNHPNLPTNLKFY